ncbi:hypothetical protein RUM44_000096 [Polyplax serrata]|uniref:Uncharacterized protein n=1 Tax=Polyplax serrata TaxID=468196 RepID=A0ABR1B4J1_POLSC
MGQQSRRKAFLLSIIFFLYKKGSIKFSSSYGDDIEDLKGQKTEKTGAPQQEGHACGNGQTQQKDQTAQKLNREEADAQVDPQTKYKQGLDQGYDLP